MRISLLLIIPLMLISCATQVTSIKQDQDRELGSDSGYVLLGIQTNRNLKGIFIKGPQNIKLSSADIKQGTNYLLVDPKTGVHTIKRVILDDHWFVDLDNEDYWTFDVKPNQISYVGHLEIVRRGFWGGYTRVELINRSSEALEFLEDKFPRVLRSHTLTYGGPGNDFFFQYLASSDKE